MLILLQMSGSEAELWAHPKPEPTAVSARMPHFLASIVPSTYPADMSG
jgi:hypothetical protein